MKSNLIILQNKIIQTYKNKGIIITLFKIFQSSFVNIVRYLSYNRKNLIKWRKLKDKFIGKRVFVIGNGPSLNRTELYLLKNEYKICFNRINILFERLNWYPNFYVCIDKTVLHDNTDEIKKEILPFVDFAFFPESHKYHFNFFSRIRNYANVLWLYYNFEEFGFNMPWIAKSPTVATAALQILTYLGFSKIYLVGVDMNYKLHTTTKNLGNNEIQSKDNDDPNHFDPRYFGKGRKYHQPTQEVMNNIFDSLERVKRNILKTNSKIFNSTYGGKLELFERVEFESLFNYTEKEKFKLFAESFSAYTIVNSYEEMLMKFRFITTYEYLSNSIEQIFLIKKSDFIQAASKFIEHFIPYGPYNSIYLLIKRECKGKQI